VRQRVWLRLTTAFVAMAAGCSDVLGLDDLSVVSATTSTGVAAGGGAGGGTEACTECSFALCTSVLAACSLDTPPGCAAFLACIDERACADAPCASGCLAEHPAGQDAVDCMCSSCAEACAMYCGSGGGAGAEGGSSGALPSGGAGGG
jgi:hypothetical protein